jgi:hypothetical protein
MAARLRQKILLNSRKERKSAAIKKRKKNYVIVIDALQTREN